MRLEDVDTAVPHLAAGSEPWAGSDAGYTCIETTPGAMSRRWRPAMMVGPGVEAFITPYFLAPAPLPWSGMVFAHHAAMIGDGLTLVGQSVLLGRGLMYPPECFPFAENRLSASRSPNGDLTIALPDREEHLPGVTLNLTSPGLAIYGHWLVDLMPRLHRAQASGIAFDRIAIPGPASPWKQAILLAMGVAETQVIYTDCLDRIYRCERMIIPTFDRFNSEVKPAMMEVHDNLRRMLGHRAAPGRVLFVSRAGWGGMRRLVEREKIEACFAERGFELVRPETLSFAAQVALFSEARVVVGECGSGLHNTLFCHPAARIGVLQASDNANFLQAQIAMVANQEAWFLLGVPVADTPPAEAFSIDARSARRFAKCMLQVRPEC